MADETRFGSSEDLLLFIKEHRDDIESFNINLSPLIRRTTPDGQQKTVSGVGAVINMLDGSPWCISIPDTELILNDGLLNRLRIPIKLVRDGESLTD